MKKPKYHITGINRLTRQREAVTPPCSSGTADAILAREKEKPSRKRIFTYLRKETCPPNG